jgi:predicted patatin/cPLA2 family phospholipase
LETPEYYRNRAANVRLEAGLVRLPHLREQFIRIAEQYDELATMIEQDQKNASAKLKGET